MICYSKTVKVLSIELHAYHVTDYKEGYETPSRSNPVERTVPQKNRGTDADRGQVDLRKEWYKQGEEIHKEIRLRQVKLKWESKEGKIESIKRKIDVSNSVNTERFLLSSEVNRIEWCGVMQIAYRQGTDGLYYATQRQQISMRSELTRLIYVKTEKRKPEQMEGSQCHQRGVAVTSTT